MGVFIFLVIVVIACIIFIPKITKAVERREAKQAEERRKAEAAVEEQKKAEALEETEKLEQIALQGDLEAQYQLGERYRSGRNFDKSKTWFKKAIANGHEKAKEVLPDVINEENSYLGDRLSSLYTVRDRVKSALEYMQIHGNFDGFFKREPGDDPYYWLAQKMSFLEHDMKHLPELVEEINSLETKQKNLLAETMELVKLY
jgi:tetratricopeptide (TPR) repeat protein